MQEPTTVPTTVQPPQDQQWLVTFSAGSLGNRRSGETIVHTPTSARARRAGIEAMERRGLAWVRSAGATVRLATAQDLARVQAQRHDGGAA